jgi:hypothetical protein
MFELKAAAAWLVILVCAVVNGAFREAVLVPRFGQIAGLVASGLLLSACILGVAVALIPWFGRMETRRCRVLGLLWLGLTLAFEFGFWRLVQHRDWPELFEAYTFKGGNLWPLVLVVTFLAPYLAARLRGQV